MKKAIVKNHLTREQEQVVKHVPLPGEIIVVKAYAGTGKTTTCKAIVKEHPHHRYLYLVFNAAMQKAVQKDFASCRTTHSLALEFTKLCIPNMSPPAGYVDVSSRNVQDDLHHFFTTSSPSPSLPESLLIWEQMKAGQRSFTHDAYLKYFCMHPRAAEWLASGWDCVMVDEAQDTNEPLAHFLLSVPVITLYLVGDPHQGIYGFRNAVNMMELAPPRAIRYHLTQSFRFGSELGVLATEYISKAKKMTSIEPIVGCAPHPTTIHTKSPCSVAHVIISRTNAAGFLKALAVVQDGKKVFFAKGKNVIQTFRDVIHKYGDHTNVPKMMEDARRKGDFELVFSLDMLSTHGKAKLTDMINTVEGGMARTMKSAHASIITCHASKGLEFDHVVINYDVDPSDDPNLFYVAITRAKKSLHLPLDPIEHITKKP